MSRYQTGKTNLDFTEARDSEWQWHQLGHMQVCTLLQTDNRASTPPTTQFFTGRMPFLPPNQQRQITEGKLVPKGKTSLHLNEQRHGGGFGIEVASAGPYANSLHLAPDINTSSLNFYRQDALPDAKPILSKH